MNNLDQKNNIAIYVRKSGELTEQEQVDRCTDYCRKHYKLSEQVQFHVYREQEDNRVEQNRLLADARTGGLDIAICSRLDRIVQSAAEFERLAQELQELSVALVAIDENIDTATPLGRTMIYAASVFARFEHNAASARIRDNMTRLAKDGKWLGGITPTGYTSKKIPAEKGQKPSFQLMVEQKQAELVRFIFSEFLASNSLTTVAAQLAEKGMTTKNGRAFSRFTVRQILENPVYMAADDDAYLYFSRLGAPLCSPREAFDGSHGIMAYNKTIQEPRKAAKARDASEWIVAVGQHEGLVSGADWVNVQTMLLQNKSGDFRKPRSQYALLSGLLRCGECGAYMRPKLTKRATETTPPTYVYMCERREKSKSAECTVQNVSGNALDKAVCSHLMRLSPEDLPVIRDASASPRFTSERPETLTELFESFQTGFDDMDIEQRRSTLRTFLDGVDWDGERIHVYLAEPEE